MILRWEGVSEGSFQLPAQAIEIGRDPEADIPLGDSAASWRHARLWSEGEHWLVLDLDSSNGTQLNGASLKPHSPTSLTPGACLTIGSTTFRLQAGKQNHTKLISLPKSDALRIGRCPTSDVVLDNSAVSWQHALLRRVGDGWILEDLGSRNGTFLDSMRIQGKVPVRPGQRLRIGLHTLALSLDGSLERTATDSPTILQADDLWHQVPTRAGQLTVLSGVSLAIQTGELIAIIGSSGAGKTSLLLALNGYLTPTKGRVTLGGHDLRLAPDLLRTAIGYVPQADIVHGDLAVEDVLRYAGSLRLPEDTSNSELAQRIEWVLQTLELSPRRSSLVRTLSGGERKRVNIAIELLSRPSILFLDEPTTGLDAGLERKVVRLLRTLTQEGCTVVVVTHAITTLDQYDRVAVMAPGGTLVGLGTPSECLKRFGAKDFEELLERAVSSASNLPRGLPSGATSLSVTHRQGNSGLGKQLITLIARQLKVMSNDQRNLALLVGQVPVISALIALLFDGRVFLGPQDADTRGKLPIQDGPQILFLLALSMSCFGLFNSVREIVKEKNIFQRERHVGLSPAAYVASKVLVLGSLTLLQSLALLALVSLRCPLGVEPSAWLIASGTLAMGGICAMLLGLMLSAWSANPDQSITTAALVLLLLVVFSGLVPLERLSGGLKLLASFNPLRWSYGGLCGTALLEDRFTQNGIERLLHDVLKTSPRQALGTLTALGMGCCGMTYLALVLRSDRDRQR